ncbi:MAG: hypothetical protein O3A20_08900 [Planctomycetota bacterium]|nr:hypothetical protein [Planctomycetota bacterium]
MLLSFTALTAPPAFPQEPASFSRDQLELTTYTPRAIDAEELFNVAQEMFGRMIRVDERHIFNLNLLYDSILIYDAPEECARIITTLTKLEQRYEQANQEMDVRHELPLLRDVPLLDFRLRAMNLHAALQALEPHMREVWARADDGEEIAFPNVQPMDEALLLIRDTQENLNAMRSLLEKLDQPPPQVTVSAWVLQGGEAEVPSILPTGLGMNLDALLPGMKFSIGSLGMLQSSAAPGHQIQLRMRGPFDRSFDLNLITGPYDAKNGRLTLDSCQFFASSPDDPDERELLFATATVLQQGEYAVIGLTGADPVMLVLRLAPL